MPDTSTSLEKAIMDAVDARVQEQVQHAVSQVVRNVPVMISYALRTAADLLGSESSSHAEIRKMAEEMLDQHIAEGGIQAPAAKGQLDMVGTRWTGKAPSMRGRTLTVLSVSKDGKAFRTKSTITGREQWTSRKTLTERYRLTTAREALGATEAAANNWNLAQEDEQARRAARGRRPVAAKKKGAPRQAARVNGTTVRVGQVWRGRWTVKGREVRIGSIGKGFVVPSASGSKAAPGSKLSRKRISLRRLVKTYALVV